MTTISPFKVRIAGVVMIALIAGLFALTAGFYEHAFTPASDVTVETARAGLIMDPGNKVKYHGVEIGRVSSVTKTTDGAKLVIAINPGELEQVPSNVVARIEASSIFGAKYVILEDGSDPSTTPLSAGAVIDVRSVTTEVNTLFQDLDHVVSTVDVTSLSQTLDTLSSALQGRGTEIADLAATADNYLTALQPSLPTLRVDLRELAKLSDLGARVAPSVIDILDNATVTSTTVVSRQQQLDRLLVDVALLGDTGTKVLGSNTQRLVYVLNELEPTARLLARYSPELPCWLAGLVRSGHFAFDAVGGTSPGLNVIATLRKGIKPFTYPRDVPGAYRGLGPSCAGLPNLTHIPAQGLRHG